MALAKGQSLAELIAAGAPAPRSASGTSNSVRDARPVERADIATSERQNAAETPAQKAVWNCVFYQVRIYQESIISEIPDLVAVAHARAKPNGPTIAPQSIIDHLKSAVKRVNEWMMDLRAGGYKLEYNTAVIADLIAAHNKILVDKFESNLGLNLASLAPMLDLGLELKKRSDAAYSAVKNKVNEAKRIEAQKSAMDAAQQASRVSGRGCSDDAVESPAMTNTDVLSCLVEFVAENQFLFFAPVSRSWRTAWAQRPLLTSFVNPDSSVSQLRYSLECGLPRDNVRVCNSLARLGKLEPLRFARQNGCVFNVDTSSEAAGSGHLPTLKFLRQSGCPWSSSTCSSAASRGHLDVLVWARNNGCPWDEMTCSGSVLGGHLAVLQWARKYGCPWRPEDCLRLARVMNHQDVLAWLEKRGISAKPRA